MVIINENWWRLYYQINPFLTDQYLSQFFKRQSMKSGAILSFEMNNLNSTILSYPIKTSKLLNEIINLLIFKFDII